MFYSEPHSKEDVKNFGVSSPKMWGPKTACLANFTTTYRRKYSRKEMRYKQTGKK